MENLFALNTQSAEIQEYLLETMHAKEMKPIVHEKG
jgi:hypothetical protein